jgi:hypothetical protein
MANTTRAYTAIRRYFDKLHQEVNSWIEEAKLTA